MQWEEDGQVGNDRWSGRNWGVRWGEKGAGGGGANSWDEM